jgi:homopolymeric O-antigen transport system ATP-binding protein
MSRHAVIRAEALGKKYVIGHQREPERYVALRDVLARTARGIARSARDLARGAPPVHGDTTEEFWALRNVSFDIDCGEVVGIIGRNGAGKSTLLKILSRITEPSEGRVAITGRVASLLEVGTGFHPELTGRENIYLNGAILGMTRAEIKRKFDEIVAFAEIERFLDTPVKRYSSGMYVRLAFAVAAHIEPEVLVVDEVLAVGDAEFQKKCLGKMGDVARGGRTVLFVSHNMAAIEALCPRSIHLAGGALVGDGSTSAIVEGYLHEGRLIHADQPVRRRLVEDGLVLEQTEHWPPTIRSGEPVTIELRFQAERPGQIRECAILLHSLSGVRVAIIDLRECVALPFKYADGHFCISVKIPEIPFVESDFSVGVYLVTNTFADDLLELDQFTISAGRRASSFAPYSADARGIVTLRAAASIDVGNMSLGLV